MYIKQLTRTIIVTFVFSTSVFAQKLDYKDYDFHPPLKIPMVLAANFGELRSNHFHTGIDFKTNRQTGYDIYSIDDGYVSRIKVSPYGYGYVVYVDHYNGLTSVYAHCDEFVRAVDYLARNQQKKEQNFEFEYYPPKDSLKVNKGQIIAKSGNTGGSTAPHLHFEIRETKTEHPINPLLFDFKIEDTRKPTIRGLKIYGLTKEGYRIKNKAKRFNVYGSNGYYSVANNLIQIPANFTSNDGGIGFAFDAIDQLNAAENICGIFKAHLLVNGDTVFSQDMTEIHFSSNRQINTHKDYEEFHQRRKHFQKAFKTVHNPLPIYRSVKNNGILNTQPDTKHQIRYVCEDVEGNIASLAFELEILEGEKLNTNTLYSNEKHLYPDSAFMDFNDDYYVLFPPGLVYEPTPLLINNSQKFYFGNDDIPLQEKYKIMFPVDDQFPNEKYYINKTDKRNRSSSIIGNVHNGWITAWVKDFGAFEVATDTIPPTISRRNFINKGNVRGKTLIWSIEDDQSGLKDYDIFIDNKWYLLKWEPKRNAFYFEAPPELKGTHKLQIKAVDACGNVSEELYQLEF
ncbi:MAG: M23 family metallopeptidase [Brumimicrobium sp.]